MTATFQAAIIGGGISGLSTAWYLQKAGLPGGQPVRYIVLEGSERWGGKIRTDRVDDSGGPFIVEAGPDSFLTQKPWALQLAGELGLQNQLLGTNDEARRIFVLNRGRLTPLPDGVALIVPTRFMPFVRSPLLSPLGKLRMGLDLLVRPKLDGRDETLADFVRRRLGAEALDKLAEPLLSGIYNAESERQSLLATFPRFRELEVKHGSLIRGMLASRRAGPSNGSAPVASAPRMSAFVSFQAGTEALVGALTAQLTGELRLNCPVERLVRAENGPYELFLRDGTSIEAETVIITTPAYTAADLLRSLAPDAATDLDAIRYVSTGTLSLAYQRDQIAHPLNGFGVVIPHSEGRSINAITWTSTKFNQRAPEGHVLIRVFFGGSRNPGTMALDDGALLSIAYSELKVLLGIDVKPLFHRIYRWERANPQYDVGHLDRIDALETKLPPGLFVTGSPYRGVGIPDCVHQAQIMASKVAEILRTRTAATAPG